MLEVILISILLSLLPIAELRGGIPYAILKDIHPLVAYFVCCLSNILVYPIVLIFLEYFHKHFLKIKYYQYLFDKFVEKTRRKTQKKIEKWGFWGIMIFVMIPLPVTGAYTGSLAAWIFNINKRKSFFAVSLGVFIAGIIVTAIVLTGVETLDFFVNYEIINKFNR